MSKTLKAVLVLSAIDRMSGVVNKALGGASAKMNKFGNQAQATGRNMMGASSALIAPVVMMTDAATKFEDKMSNVATIVDTSKESVDGMGKSILKMATDDRIPVGINDMSDALYQVRSAGIPATKAMDELRNSSILSVAGLSTVTEATDIMTSSANAFSKEGLTAAQRSDMIFKAVKAGKTDVAKLSQAFGANAAIMANANVKLSDYLAGTAALTGPGVSASQAQNQLRAAVVALIKPTAQMDKVFKKLGVSSGEQLIETSGSMGAAFEKVKATAQSMGVNLGKAFGSVEALSAVQSLGGAQANAYTSTLADMTTGSNAITEAFNKQSKTGKAAMQLFRNNVQALSITLGNTLIPMLNSLMERLSSVASWVRSTAERYPGLAKAVMFTTAAVGGLLGVLGAFSFVVGTVSKGIAAMTMVTNLLTSASTYNKIATIAGTVAQWAKNAAMVAAYGSALVLVTVYQGLAWAANALKVSQIAGTVATKALTAVQWLWNAALTANPIGIIIVAVGALIAGIVALTMHFEDIHGWFMKQSTAVKVLVASFAIVIAPILAIGYAVNWLVRNWDDMVAGVKRAINRVVSHVTWLYDGVVRVFTDMWDFITGIPGRFYDAGVNIINSIKEGIMSAAGALVDTFSGIIEDLTSWLPFSPAKQGPMKRIMKVRITQSIAETMDPNPMVNRMKAATVATNSVLEQSPVLNQSVVQGAGATPPAGGVAAPTPVASARGGGVVVNFQPTVSISGAAEGDEGIKDQVMRALAESKQELYRMVQEATRVSTRGAFE